MSAALLVGALRDPATTAGLDAAGWNSLIAMARAERLIGTLAFRLEGQAVPDAVRPILADAKEDAAREAQQAVWEADRARAALAPIGLPVILLKGTAYAAAGLPAGWGRFIGDLDILVPRDRIDAAADALIAAGWEWVKEDPYDDAYYRRWMHELPPMIHTERDRMIDVHHTVLPLTARPTPDAAAMMADAVLITDGLYMLSAEDRVCHAVAHLLADGDLQGGLRNLWDIHCLLADVDPEALKVRAARHGITPHVRQAQRLAAAIYGTGGRLTLWDRLVRARLLARNGWGQETRKALVFAFFVRSHWLRMPPLMLARHLLTKWRKGHRPQ
ncbi:nucleotidyltransferase family protein [Sphingobium yanoikuyae]|uniref:Nucleotidyltransferase family protein n=1 Tax=Sphingobium yanoikuyae TaxID=13690 RepID=A0A6M4G9G9_SPHYA|nr:nucleotidyltransferase family protein [Sphingobium yanoikuyae]QJR03616.1 nucleotidyltransferase family protein [Sphingobium yanoikuyae]